MVVGVQYVCFGRGLLDYGSSIIEEEPYEIVRCLESL